MARRCHLSRKQFQELIECSLSRQQFEETLVSKEVLHGDLAVEDSDVGRSRKRQL